MGRRKRKRKSNAAVNDFAPGLESVIDYISKFRAMTGKSKRLLEEYLLPEKTADTHYREGPDGKPIFNLSEKQIEWIFPESVRENWDYEKDYDRDFSDVDKDFLNDLVPEITPPESYFEEEELPVLHAQNTPLSSAPIDYISTFIIKLCL